MVLKRLTITALGALGLGALAAGTAFADLEHPDSLDGPAECNVDAGDGTPGMTTTVDPDCAADEWIDDGENGGRVPEALDKLNAAKTGLADALATLGGVAEGDTGALTNALDNVTKAQEDVDARALEYSEALGARAKAYENYATLIAALDDAKAAAATAKTAYDGAVATSKLGAPKKGSTPASGLYIDLAAHQADLKTANDNLTANAYLGDDADKGADKDNPAGRLAWDLVDGDDLGQAVVDAVSDTYHRHRRFHRGAHR